ncbi:MAG TPA: AEC family transporter [Bacillota bacterium]|nr:AEC family transporter [Bacillota bacterium]HPJ24300.1 AEC family transporter [Bacillota bacterium]
MDTLIFSLNAVLPILLLILFGYILKRVRFVDEHFLQIGNKFVFRVALPTLLFYTIYSIEGLGAINWPVVLYAVIGILILFILGLVLSLTLIKDKKQRGVLIQATFRANFAIIGIPIADALGGLEAVGVVALIAAIVVPIMNILAVISLTLFVHEGNEDMHPFKSSLLNVVKNPLIIATLIGLLALWIRSYIPVDSVTGEHVFSLQKNFLFLYTAISWVSRIASPFALIILGGTFEFIVIKHMAKQIFYGTFARVVLAPVITLSLAVYLSNKTGFFNFTSIEYPALIALFASPTAISGAIMAKEMNNDAALAVQYVVWTTTLSILSLFFIVFIFRSLNLI